LTKALITTLPKSGTHLVNVLMKGLGFTRHVCELAELNAGLLHPDPEVSLGHAEALVALLDAMPDRHFVLHHIPYHSALIHKLAKRNIRAIALIRNPLDFVVSLAHHLHQYPEDDALKSASQHEMQHWICSGVTDAHGHAKPPLAKRYFRMMTRWISDQRVRTLRFEDIVGPRGGGLFSDQLATTLDLCAFLDAELDRATLTHALAGSYRPGIALFRKGQIGSWKKEMASNTAEQIRLLYPWAFDGWGYTLDGSLTHHANERAGMMLELDAAAAALVHENAHLRAKVSRLFGPEDEAAPSAETAPLEAAADDAAADVAPLAQAPYSNSTI
jgi:Sulfotransferase domain